MARDIEEFLKKAAERRAAQQQGRPQTSANAPVQNRELARPAPRPPAPVATPVIIDDDEIEIVEPVGQSVSQHVSKYIDTKDVTSHADTLGDEVALADDKMDARMHKTFDHSVSRLVEQKSSRPATETGKEKGRQTTSAQNIFEMLRSPKTIRDAILISEVLKRPDFD